MTRFEDTVAALGKINEAVSRFDDAVKPRAVDVLLPLLVDPPDSTPAESTSATSGPVGAEFQTAADFYSAADPRTEPDRALVMAYYMIRIEGKPDVGAGDVNDALRAIQGAINNIGRAMIRNVTERRLMQTGRGPRGRRYGLTARGESAVQALLRRGANN